MKLTEWNLYSQKDEIYILPTIVLNKYKDGCRIITLSFIFWSFEIVLN